MLERIGLFGGSFDPVHRTHLALARSALQTLALDRVLWIPAGQPWQKARPMTAAAHRLAMLRLALADEPRFEVDTRELDRGGLSYTVDTVEQLCAEHPGAEFVLLIGEDQHAAFHTWHRWRDIAGRVRLAVASRAGTAPVADAEVQRLAVLHVPLPATDLAATAIRDRVARGEGIADLVPAQVARYIDRQGLYGARSVDTQAPPPAHRS